LAIQQDPFTLESKFFFLFFSFSGDDCISGYHLKKDLALMATSYWKTLKTVQNLAE